MAQTTRINGKYEWYYQGMLSQFIKWIKEQLSLAYYEQTNKIIWLTIQV